MDRDKQLQTVKAIMDAGNPLLERLPKAEVCLIEEEPGHFIDLPRKRLIPENHIERYLTQLKGEYPNHLIQLTTVYHAEFLVLSKKLEEPAVNN